MPVAHAKRVSAKAHNRVLDRALARVDRLEEKLAAELESVLEQAGQKAASRFHQHVLNYLTAAALRERDAEALSRQAPGFLDSGGFFGFRIRPFALTASAPSSTSTMVALKPRPDEAARIAWAGGEEPDTLHVTLAYLGSIEGDLGPIREALAAVAASHAPLAGVVGGVGRFQPPGVAILLPDVPGLVELRVAVTEALHDAGIVFGREHGFEAHISVDADPDPDSLEEALQRTAQMPLHFDAILIVRGDAEVIEVPLVGPKPLTAAAPPSPGPPQWSPPGADEVIDVDALVAQLRTKTDPVRLALLEAVFGASLKQAGLDFDIANPLVGHVLAQAGSQVQGIAETTQLNVMRIIGKSWDNGLSIPDTAKAIRVGMKDASAVRARLIARTELVGVAGGSSLAATQIVEDATGSSYHKVWQTASGAHFPRHEVYDGLDGQSRNLDEPFDVGGSALMFPGDPAGPPEEVCNCVAGGSLVSLPGLRYATRRRYTGDLLGIHFASGDYLAVTPNHPVLRADGAWVAAYDLHEGDHCVSGRLIGSLSGKPNPDRVPTEAAEVYRLAEEIRAPERVHARGQDFHGDVLVEGEVDVVAVHRDLRSYMQAATDEKTEQFGFALADAARAGRGSPLGAFGVVRVADARLLWAAPRSISGLSETSPFELVGAGHPLLHGRAASAEFDSGIDEMPSYLSPGDSGLLREGEDAFAVEVTTDEVVSVEIDFDFDGDVFNFDTGHGFYFTGNGIVSGNCRCTLTYAEGEAAALAAEEQGIQPDSGEG